MKILGHSRVISALSSVRDLSRQINSKAISQSLRNPVLQSLRHLRDPKKENYSSFRVSQMSINGADAQRKNHFGDKKIVSNFWQKPNNVSSKKRDALMEKANDFISKLNDVERAVGKLRHGSYEKMKNNILEARVGQQDEAREIYDGIDKNIVSARGKIQKLLQKSNLSYQHKASLHKAGLSESQYYEIIKDFDNIKEDFQSSLKTAKNKLDNLNKF